MKDRWNRALALLMALLLTIAAVAIAEEAAPEGDATGEPAEIAEIESTIEAAEIEPGVEEAGEIALDDLAGIPAGDTPIAGEPAAEDASQDADWNGADTWWFIAGDTVVATQEAREGDEILRPEDPAAPEGMTFDGWYFEDGTPLLADADGDGEIDAVIAHPDPLIPDVNVFARFVEADEPAEEPANEEPVTEEPAAGEPDAGEPVTEEPATEETATEEPAAEEPAAEEPATEEPVEKETTEPSPLGEDAEQSEAEEVVPQNTDEDEPEEEETASSVSPDGEPASQGSADPDSLESVHWTDSQALVPPEGEALEAPTANELTYTGKAQALVSGEGWLYSLDGEAYSAELPAAVNAGEYTVYFIPADAPEAQPQALTVTVAKADVVFTAPVAAATGE